MALLAITVMLVLLFRKPENGHAGPDPLVVGTGLTVNLIGC